MRFYRLITLGVIDVLSGLPYCVINLSPDLTHDVINAVTGCHSLFHILITRIRGVMVSVLASSAVDRGLEHKLGQTKNYKIATCCFSARHAVLMRRSKYWLVRNLSLMEYIVSLVVSLMDHLVSLIVSLFDHLASLMVS
jgi:hypothetical protein